MAKYIKQELSDFQGTGENKCFYRLQTSGTLSPKELITRIAQPGSGLSEGTVAHVLQSLKDEMARAMADGYSVSVDGLGTFKATVGVREDKEMDTIDGNEPKHNATSLQVTGINYKANKELIRDTDSHCHLVRGGVRKLCRSRYTKEERLQLALDYLNDPAHPFMRLDDYVVLTGLSKTVASKELVEFRENTETGITTTGRGSNKVYLKRITNK
ncbi:MAG: HU family DNA-binding protein [Bacteroidales bacterium]|nr:HU family DNA-binding protein [Bacteroidales bacterium]MDD4821971.1 HU family DNA-binding protein [Bacteroidales bacterium]